MYMIDALLLSTVCQTALLEYLEYLAALLEYIIDFDFIVT